MIHFFKFRQDLFGPVAGREVFHKPGKGRGWPEECPPIRAANGFGFDLLANFSVEFRYVRGAWRVTKPRVVESDFEWEGAGELGVGEVGSGCPVGHSASGDLEGTGEAGGRRLRQDYAWFWEKGQVLPHVISDNVYAVIKHQVKVSTFLYLASDANEVLLITDVPNVKRPFKAVSALVETDWYPASYPWHCVLELDPAAKVIKIKKGEPLCRVVPVRRDTYFARAMTTGEFDAFFERGQRWLAKHGRGQGEMMDITRTYGRQGVKSGFVVREE